ncbi:hypothetical protein [Stenotrophomonas acidaminiphila]
MGTELAYSEQFNDVVNAERAYELYWANVITDKRAFLCSEYESGCPARYTCANMDTEQLQLKQVPHFRNQTGSMPHMNGCPNLFEQEARGRGSDVGQASEAGQPAPDRFLLTRPAGHFAIRERVVAGGIGVGCGHNEDRGGGGKRSRGAELYSLAGLVSRWLKARRDNVDSKLIVSAGTQGPMTYREMFENFFVKRPSLSGEKRVYWSKAWINATPKGHRIRFCTSVNAINGQELEYPIFPSAMIWKNVLAESEMKKLHTRRLIRYSDTKKPCVVFIYGAPKLQERDGRKFINFDVGSLDHLDVQGVDLFERIRRAKK